MTRRLLVMAIAIGASAAVADTAGDSARGEALFRQCASCHQIGEGAEHKVGPLLNHIFDRSAGAAEGFRYSKAMAEADLRWDNRTLDAFLENPRTALPGTRMAFRGLRDSQDRLDLIAYMHRFSDELPVGEAAGADYEVAPAILSLAGDVAYGEYLSSDCTSCHQPNGGDSGIPNITGWPVAQFVTVMHAYKDKARVHPVMEMMAGRLSNEEIAALAAYFGGVE